MIKILDVKAQNRIWHAVLTSVVNVQGGSDECATDIHLWTNSSSLTHFETSKVFGKQRALANQEMCYVRYGPSVQNLK
jgi:hypothetical protein